MKEAFIIDIKSSSSLCLDLRCRLCTIRKAGAIVDGDEDLAGMLPSEVLIVVLMMSSEW